MKSIVPVAALSIAALLLAACQPSSQDSAGPGPDGNGKPVVSTVNYPLAYFAERIGGDRVEVVFPAPADEDPAFWEPNDETIAAFQQADLILLNGATYAKWVRAASLPESTQVDTSKAFSGEFIETTDGKTHQHGTEGAHSHAGTAFTTWLDFQQALWQAEAVRDALLKILPAEAKPEIDQRFESLAGDLEKLDAELGSIGKALQNRPLLASHPVYQYFARAYGLNLRALLWEPETVPDDQAMADLGKLQSGHDAKWMIWEGDPAPESVAKLEKAGIGSVVFDPCGNRPDDGDDFLTVMKKNVANLKALLP